MNHGVPILTYHSQNIEVHNDHDALAGDLEALHAAGWRIVSLDQMLTQRASADVASRTLCLTFDDGCDFDVRDIDYPRHGVQRSFAGTMNDFISRHGADAQPGMHATSFVIASTDARAVIDRKSLFGRGWMSHDWWGKEPLIGIGNHGWDHNHPDLGPGRGGFTQITHLDDCRKQVEDAAREIEHHSGAWPEFFAYPFGESSDFMRSRYFPEYTRDHRCRAALGTEPGMVTDQSDVWNLPRYVCGRDWHSPDGLLALLQQQ